MRTFRIVLAYDGTDFHGWQAQDGPRTVQGVLEDALEEALGSRPRLAAAGRTDAGVHARGQVASFESETELPVSALAPVLNQRLPPDLRVCEAREAPSGFHARFSAIARRYAYRVLIADDVLLRRFAWWPPRGADPERLAVSTRVLEGEHDFASFQSAGSTPASPVCRIHRASWERAELGLRFDVVADRFLYHMVRTIVGTVFRVAREEDPAAAMRAVLEARDRGSAGVTAPARGLSLEQVFYPEDAGT